MKNIKMTVALGTAFLVLYILSHHLNVSLVIPMLLFCFSPFVMIWMVISILKDGTPSKKKFSDGHFYEDYDHKSGKFLPPQRD